MVTALVTDSTAYLQAEVVATHGIQVVPLHVIVGGKEHREGVSITAGEVAEALRSYTPVSTSRPAPQAFLDAYRAAADAGADSIVSVHISAELSSTLSGAQLAATSSPVPVTVVDSRSMGMGMGYAVLTGCEVAARGGSAEQVAEAVRQRCGSSSVVFYVDTLEFLRRGGRIGKANALLGSALAIKPILGLVDGRIEPLEKVRTASKAIARLEELSAAAAEEAGALGVDVAVHHLDSAERAHALTERLRARLGSLRDLRMLELGAVVGAHVGPGTLAVSVSPSLPS